MSDARNYGLKCASGKYVFFCDSDDMVIPSGLSEVIEKASKTNDDVILWDGISIDEDDREIKSGKDIILIHSGLDKSGGIISGIEAMVDQIKDHKTYAMTAWLLACRRDFLLDNGLYFEKGLIHEDELWTPQVLICASKVLYVPEKVYCYRIRKNSIMDSLYKDQEQHSEAYIQIFNLLFDLYSSFVNDKHQRSVLLSYWADTYMWDMAHFGFYKFECRKQIPRRKIMSAAGSFKSKLKGIFLFVFGVRPFCRLMISISGKREKYDT